MKDREAWCAAGHRIAVSDKTQRLYNNSRRPKVKVTGRDLSNSGDEQAEHSDICIVERLDYFTSKTPSIFKLCDSISSLF